MNKAELIEALADRLGDRRAATSALDAVLAEVQAAVAKGDRVAITGFGVFEKRVRGPRTARNPRTGEAVKVKKTSVPTFKPGTGFKEMVASGRVPKAAPAKAAGPAKKAAGPAKKAAAKKAPAKKAAAKKAPATKKAAVAKKTTAKKTTTKAVAAKKAPAKKTTAKKTTAKKTTARKSTARKSTARR